MESRNGKKDRADPITKFLNSRPIYLPVYGRLKVKSQKDKDIQRLLRSENSKTKETKRLQLTRAKLIKKLKAVDGHLYANSCTIYTYWIQLRQLLPKK